MQPLWFLTISRGSYGRDFALARYPSLLSTVTTSDMASDSIEKGDEAAQPCFRMAPSLRLIAKER
jgi:hypothetical protein